jgi:hypothetical protein
MSKKRYVNTTFWRDDYISSLDPSEKLLFLYLLTCPDTTIAGVYQIPIKIIAADTGFDKDMIVKILERLERDGKVLYRDGWIAIKNFLKHQSENPSVRAGVERELVSVPQDMIDFVTACRQPVDSLSDSDIVKYSKVKLSKGESKVKQAVFNPPTPDEVQAYLDSQKAKFFDGEQFCDFYTARGWLIGKNKMKDWRAAVRTWIRRDKEKLKAELRCFDD